MIRIDIADVAAADRLIEALYVAAGQRRGTQLAVEWHALAFQIESGIDALPILKPCCPACQVEPTVPCHNDGRPLYDGMVHHQRYTEAEGTAA